MQLNLATIKIGGFWCAKKMTRKIVNTIIVNRSIPLLFLNKILHWYLEIIVKLIIVVVLQINQCKDSIHLLASSLLIKVQSQLKVRIVRLSIVNSIKVQSQLILLCLIMSIPLFLHQIENLINQSKVLTNFS